LCGIAGFTHRDGAVDPQRILGAIQSIVHRGPDEQDVYESQSVSLGAVRLKIIDLQDGQQPMMTQDRNTILVFNGEIYNHQELRRELEKAGYSFHSRSDTEVVLRAFEAWDTACFSRLRGMFAIAVWIESEKRLVLARDRMGIKPLYVHRRGEDIYFGSELKTLFTHAEIERNLDHRTLEYYLYLNYVPCPHTLIQGIEKLRPGHLLEWKNGSVTTRTYWQCVMAPQEDLSQPEAEAELDRLLTESVKEHLVADVPVGVWLSGGVDSSTILHYASKVNSSRLKTFSISFAGRSFDERRYIREMVQRFGTEHYELDLNPSLDLSAAIEELSYYSDEPFADAGALPVWFLSAMTRRHAIVALSGEGADELFGGYVTYRADRLSALLRRAPRFLLRGLVSCANLLPVSDDKISFEYKLRRFMEGSLLPADEAHTYWNGSFSTAQQARLLHYKNGTKVARLYGIDSINSLNPGSLNRFLAFDQQYYLPDDILQKVDRMSMAHSIEVRPPFLDHRLVEFAAKLPEHFKIRGNSHKYLLKSLMRNKLPASVLQRPKTGLDIPTHDWLRGPLRPLLMETLRPEAVEATGIFRQDAVEFFLKEHLERRANLGFHLWGLLILFLWMKQWDIQVVPAAESKHTTVADFFVPT
jgi:asparagine synthase (glutamine-hydrolysing)